MVSTPRAAEQMALIGRPISRGAVSLTRDEYSHLADLYGYKQEHVKFLQSGADVNMMRHAETDGLRIMAWLARYVPAGEDPLKTVVLAMAEKYDVDPADVAWANDVEDDEHDDE